MIRNLDADGALARHAFDQDALGAHRQAKIFSQSGYAAVLYAGFGADLKGSDDGSGIDLNHLTENVELRAFLDEHLGLGAQRVLADDLRIFAAMEEGAGRKLESADRFGSDRCGVKFSICPLADGNVLFAAPSFGLRRRLWGGGLRSFPARHAVA